MSLHPILARAARGELPPWAEAGSGRVAHVERVSRLLGDWADAYRLDTETGARWRAAGLLHDVLRDAAPAGLRRSLGTRAEGLPDRVLHGPAAASRLREEGVDDEPFLRAVAFHTIGHPDLDAMGRHLYIADFVEPGRKRNREWLAELRGRMPDEYTEVLRQVVAARVARLLDGELPLPPETVGFWNTVVQDGDG